jgi:hypothetical protein
MTLKVLDSGVLKRDLPGYGLKAGVIGAVVELDESDGVEVEFAPGSGNRKPLSR